MIRTGMFSKVGDVSFILRGDVIVQLSEPSPKASGKDALSPEIRVAYHDIFRKRLTVGTKAGVMTIALGGKLADQERTIDHVLAAFQQNGNLAHLEDKDNLASGDEDG